MYRTNYIGRWKFELPRQGRIERSGVPGQYGSKKFEETPLTLITPHEQRYGHGSGSKNPRKVGGSSAAEILGSQSRYQRETRISHEQEVGCRRWLFWIRKVLGPPILTLGKVKLTTLTSPPPLFRHSPHPTCLGLALYSPRRLGMPTRTLVLMLRCSEEPSP